MKIQRSIVYIILITMIILVSCGKKESLNKEDTLELKLLLTISGKVDTEDSVRTFKEIEDLEIDSKGNIFLLEAKNGKIMKFNKKGDFITSFGKLGKEPGEFPFSLDFVNIEDMMYVKSFPNKKIVKFDNNGKYIETFDYTSAGQVIGEILRSVSDEKIVGYINKVEDKVGVLHFGNNLVLMNKKFEQLAVLREYFEEFDPYNPKYYETVTKYASGDGKIYVAENDDNSYKINIFDMDGNKIEQITHDYTKIEYNQYETEKIKTLNLLANGNRLIEQKSFKKSINDLFYDKYGRLLVCSSIERTDENQRDFIIDIYKDGVYINTTKVDNLIGEDFVQRFDSRIYFFGDKIYEIVNGEAKVNIYAY